MPEGRRESFSTDDSSGSDASDLRDVFSRCSLHIRLRRRQLMSRHTVWSECEEQDDHDRHDRFAGAASEVKTIVMVAQGILPMSPPLTVAV